MKRYNKTPHLAAIAASTLALAGSASAATVWNVNIGSEDLTGYQGAATENPAAGSSWNSVNNNSPTNLVDSGGGAGTVTFDISNDSGFGTTGTTVGDTIFRSWHKDGGGGTGGNSDVWTASFGGLSTTTGTTYDVVTYSGWFWGPENGVPVALTAGTGLAGTFTLNSLKMDGGALATGLAEDTDSGNNPGNFNYARFNGLTADGSGNLTFSYGVNQAFANDFPINGFQLIENAPAPIPEPSTTALLGLGGLALVFRRRK